MSEIDEKLAGFKYTVLNEAMAEREELLAKAINKKETRMGIEEMRLLEATYQHIRKTVEKINKEKNAHILNLDMRHKQQMLEMREQYIAEIIDAVREKLAAFAASAEYDKYMAKNIDKLKSIQGMSLVKLREADMRFKQQLNAEGFDVQQSTDISLGGFIAIDTDKGHLVDYTLDAKLTREKEFFLENNNIAAAAQQ